MQLNNQVALVTGGLSGLGAACVSALRARHVRVMVWDIEDSKQEDYQSCDVRDEQAVAAALKIMLKTIGAPRICIQCAGIAPARRMVNKQGVIPLQAFKNVIDVNLIGSFNVMSQVAAAMIEHVSIDISLEDRGVIINTASVAAFDGQIGQTAYSASKGGVVALTLPAARELASHGIRVNTIAPGIFATPLLLTMSQEVQDSLAASVPYPHRLGKPEEYAALALHIVENSMLNGEVIRLDGAIRMQAK